MWWLAVLACRNEEDPGPVPAPAGDTPATTDTDWGVVGDCAGESRGGFDPLYADGTAILVYGESTRDRELAEQVHEWYASSFTDLAMRRASELTDAEKAEDLMIFGSPDTNGLLGELNGELAVWFDAGSFEFGGYTYAEPGHGLALVSPNPSGADRWVVLYAGNTLDGAYSTFTIPTGGHDYETTRGRGVLQQEGTLCHESWSWYRRFDEDLRKAWDRWVEDLVAVESEYHTFLFEPGSDADRDADWFPDWQTDQHVGALIKLDVDPLDHPIRTYLYTTRALKEEMTGSSGNGHANDLNFEVHALYGEDTYAVGAHEDVHVIAWHRIGDANTALMGEGLAVWVDEVWLGEPLDDWGTTFRDSGEIPPLQALIDDFWSHDDLLTYPLAGHFVGFLVDGWGIDATKRIYAAPDLAAALLEETGLDVPGVEAAWLASIP